MYNVHIHTSYREVFKSRCFGLRSKNFFYYEAFNVPKLSRRNFVSFYDASTFGIKIRERTQELRLYAYAGI